MACTSRSYWDSSSSCAKEVVPKTATGCHRRSAKTTFRPEVVPGHQVAQVGDPPDPLRLGVPHADLGVSVHLHWLVGARRRPSRQLVEQAYRLLRL